MKNNKNNMRKIIQISKDSQPLDEHWEAWSILTGLYDDGTLWEVNYSDNLSTQIWRKLPDIPQTDD